MTKQDRFIWAILLSALVALFAFCASALLSGCGGTEPAAAPPAFVGKWIDDSRPPAVLSVEFRADHSVTFEAFDGGESVGKQAGQWTYSPPLLITRDTACQEGNPVRLVPCQAEPDTVRPAIVGDSWRLTRFEGGQVYEINLRRVQ